MFVKLSITLLLLASVVAGAQDKPKPDNPYIIITTPDYVAQPAPKNAHEWIMAELHRLRDAQKADDEKTTKELEKEGYKLANPDWNYFRDLNVCFGGNKCSSITVDGDGKVILDNISPDDALLLAVVEVEQDRRDYQKIIADKDKQLQEICVFLNQLRDELQKKVAARKNHNAHAAK